MDELLKAVADLGYMTGVLNKPELPENPVLGIELYAAEVLREVGRRIRTMTEHESSGEVVSTLKKYTFTDYDGQKKDVTAGNILDAIRISKVVAPISVKWVAYKSDKETGEQS